MRRLAVQVIEPPNNHTFSPPLVSESHQLPPVVGHFALSDSALLSKESSLETLVVLPLPQFTSADQLYLAGGLRTLLGWSLQSPLQVHLVGQAMCIVRALLKAAPPMRRSPRPLRAHRFSATAMRLPEAYARALQSQSPGCSIGSATADVLRLLAPLLLQRLPRPPASSSAAASHALILDPTALVLEPPSHVLRHLMQWAPRWPHCIMTTSRVGIVGANPADEHDSSRLNSGASSAALLSGHYDIAGVMAVDLGCTHSSGWQRAFDLARRRRLAAHPMPSANCGAASMVREVSGYLNVAFADAIPRDAQPAIGLDVAMSGEMTDRQQAQRQSDRLQAQQQEEEEEEEGDVNEERWPATSDAERPRSGDDAATASPSSPHEVPPILKTPRSSSRLIGCEWAYQPAAHATLRHHTLVTASASEGFAALYVSCQHTNVHQAFAAAWGRAHGRAYADWPITCGCGVRVRVLLPPRDETGETIQVGVAMAAVSSAAISSGSSAAVSSAAFRRLEAMRSQLPTLFIEGG